jgi:predicted phosphodiesterase
MRTPRSSRILGVLGRIALVFAVVVSVAQLLASGTYGVAGGDLTLRVRPAWPGGQLVMPLGPAGRVEMHAYKAPLNVEVRYELAGEETIGDIGRLTQDLPGVQASAVRAFTGFAISRIPWLVVLGISGGLLIAGRSPRTMRRVVVAAGLGVIGVAIVTMSATGLVYATLDRTPIVSYHGLARDLPSVMTAVRNGSEALQRYDLDLGGFAAALETISRQLVVGATTDENDDVVRLLLVTDVHVNPVGSRLAARLARSEVEPVDAVLLGGDMTYFGTEPEAQLFATALGKPGVPVIAVGGNHESAPAMDYFAELGWRVLDGTMTDVKGVSIMGFSDPVAGTADIVASFASMDQAASVAAEAWSVAQPRPDVVLVHDVAQAEDVIAAAASEGRQLVVMHGHSHVVSVSREGSVTVVDGGTAGASSVIALGAAPDTPYTFQIVEFAADAGVMRPVAVTTLSYIGDGSSRAEYQLLGR